VYQDADVSINILQLLIYLSKYLDQETEKEPYRV